MTLSRVRGLRRPVRSLHSIVANANPAAFISGAPLLLWQAAFFIGALTVLGLMSFWSIRNFQPVAEYTTEAWADLMSSRTFPGIYLRTFLYSAIAAVSFPVLAFPFAYALAFTVSPKVRRLAILFLIAPFFTSYIVRSYSWYLMLADNGLLNTGLTTLGFSRAHILGTPAGILIGYFNFFFPLIVVALVLSLSNVRPELRQAAKNLGAGRLRTLWTVTIPSAKVGIVFAISFGFVLAFGDFIAPALLGSGREVTLSILIVDRVQGGGNFPGAAAVGIIMAASLIAVVLGTYRLAFPRK